LDEVQQMSDSALTSAVEFTYATTAASGWRAFRRRSALARDEVRHRAAGAQIGHQHRLARREDLGRLRHEVHAAEDDHVGVGLRRFLREAERVAEVVADRLDLHALVVVAQDHRVQLPCACA
jgi:hypothetical protein